MLNIEVIKFEAQDVITASVCKHDGEFVVKINNPLDAAANTFACKGCDAVFAGKNVDGKLVPDFSNKK